MTLNSYKGFFYQIYTFFPWLFTVFVYLSLNVHYTLMFPIFSSLPVLIWTKLFLSSFWETKTGTCLFKVGAHPFEQVPASCKQRKLADAYSQGNVFCFFLFWSIKSTQIMCCLKQTSTCSERSTCLF